MLLRNGKRISMYCQRGLATLVMALVGLLTVSATSIYTAASLVQEAQTSSNLLKTEKASSAAQAGVNYALPWLTTNRSTVTNAQVLSGTLSDGSTYSVTLTFIGSKDKVAVTSVGVSPDGISKRVVKVITEFASDSSGSPLDSALYTRNTVSLASNAEVHNLVSNTTIHAGSNVSLSPNAATYTSAGQQSSNGNIQADVIQNDSSVANIADAVLQTTMLGQTISSMSPSSPNHTYDSSSATANVPGKQGVTILVNGNLTLDSNNTVGTASNPVVLYVTGNVTINSNVTIYGTIISTGGVTLDSNVTVNGDILATGNVALSSNTSTANGLVFSLGDVTMASNSTVYGGVVAGGTIVMNSFANVYYTPDNIQTGGPSSSSGSYGYVSGSWQDLDAS